MLNPKNFKCGRCADCCRYLRVKLFKKDIEAIKEIGYNKDFFEGYDAHIRSPVLKVRNNGCVFLGKRKGEYYCRIYEARPKVCRLYPFVNSNMVKGCKPNLLKHRFEKQGMAL